MSMYDVHTGHKVFTRDGRELGTVAEVESDRFKVDAPLQADYWLRTRNVLSVIPEERVTVDFDFDDVDAHRETESLL